MIVKMGRKKKCAQDYARDFRDFEVCPSDENGKDDHVTLICKYCRTTIKSDQGRAAVRLAEHVKSARHVKLKAAHSEPGKCNCYLIHVFLL